MVDSKPKLSEDLDGPRDPERCQACGARWVELSRWWECDENDQPTRTLIVACQKCAKTVITPHDRLYIELQPNQHHPGSMELCQLCHHRDGLTCRESRWYGGPGVEIMPPPSRMHLLTSPRKYSGWHTLWRPARECSKRTVLVLVSEEF